MADGGPPIKAQGESVQPSRPNGRSWGPLVVLFGCWLVSRLLLIAVGLRELPFYPKGPLAFDDLDVYARWIPDLTAGRIPTDDMWQYPPFSAVFFVIGRLGSDPATTVMIAVVLVDLVLTAVFANHRMKAAWYWVLFGLVVGPVLVSRFDVVPTLFAVLAVLAVARPVAVGAWAAVGAALKVWPVLVLLIVPRRKAAPAGVSFIAVTIGLLLVTTWLFDGISGFLGGQGSRGLQVESVAALPFMVANAVGLVVPLEYRYGSMEVAADGAGVAATVVTVLAIALFAWVVVSWWRGRLARFCAADVAFTVVLFSVVVSRVFSPQYTIWLLGLGVLCLVDPDSVVRAPVVMVAFAAALAQILYPFGYGAWLSGDGVMGMIQVIRILLVVAAAVWAGYRLLVAPSPEVPVGEPLPVDDPAP